MPWLVRTHDDVPTGAGEMGVDVNVRIPVDIHHHRAPEPIRDGETPTRVAMAQITAHGRFGNGFQKWDFATLGGKMFVRQLGAWTPAGRNSSVRVRGDIARAAAVSYAEDPGSLAPWSARWDSADGVT